MTYKYRFNEGESREFYLAQIEGYKTVSAMKAQLTRFRKQCEEYHDDLVKAYNRPSRMLHGEIVTCGQIKDEVREICLIQEIYNSL